MARSDPPKQSTSKSTGSGSAQRRRKPRAVTLDLKATEVAGDQAVPAGTAGKAGKDDAASEKAAAAGPAKETASSADKADAGKTAGANSTVSKEPAGRADAKTSKDPAGDAGKQGADATTAKGAGSEQTKKSAPGDRTAKTAGGGSGGSLIGRTLRYGLAAVVGGMLALALYAGLARFGWAPIPQDPAAQALRTDVAAVSGETAALGERLARLEADNLQPQITALSERTDALGRAVEQLPSGLLPASEGAALREAVSELRNDIAALSGQAGDGGAMDGGATEAAAAAARNADAIARLQEQIASLVPADGANVGEVGAEVGALTDKLAALERQVAALASRPPAGQAGGQAGDQAVEGPPVALAGDLDALRSKVGQQVTALEAQIAAAGERTDTALASVSSEVTALRQRLDELSARLTELGQRQDGRAAASAAIALASGALNRAIRAGTGFAEELAVVADYASDRPELEVLKGAAARGIATMSELRERYGAMSRDVLAADAAADTPGLLGDLMARMQQVVTVRPVGEVAGDSTAAVLARGEARLAEGDLSSAVDELQALDGAAAEAAAAWLEAARQRLAVTEAAQRLTQTLLEGAPGLGAAATGGGDAAAQGDGAR